MPVDDQVPVLHVDDDKDVLEITAAFLEQEDDLSVETATSASEGLERLAEAEIDCIVSDYDMPRRDGLEFLTAVRDRGYEIPFILFTGHGNEAVASEAVSAGVSDYLQKETGTEQYDVLANRIRNYAYQYRTQQEIERVRTRYELVARAASDVIFEWDSERDHIIFSAGFAERFGTDPPEEPTEGWWLQKIHPDDRPAVKERLADAISAGEVEVTMEYRFEHADGSYRHVTEDRHHLFDDDEVTRVVGAFRDVTERRQREQRLDALHTASRDLMTAETVDAVIEVASQTAKEILDLPINAIYRREGEQLFPMASTERTAEVFGDVPVVERGEALVWEAVDSGETRAYDDVTETGNVYNEETAVRSEFYVPIGDFGVFIAGSTVPDDFEQADVTLVKVLLANTEAALDRIRT